MNDKLEIHYTTFRGKTYKGTYTDREKFKAKIKELNGSAGVKEIVALANGKAVWKVSRESSSERFTQK